MLRARAAKTPVSRFRDASSSSPRAFPCHLRSLKPPPLEADALPTLNLHRASSSAAPRAAKTGCAALGEQLRRCCAPLSHKLSFRGSATLRQHFRQHSLAIFARQNRGRVLPTNRRRSFCTGRDTDSINGPAKVSHKMTGKIPIELRAKKRQLTSYRTRYHRNASFKPLAMTASSATKTNQSRIVK